MLISLYNVKLMPIFYRTSYPYPLFFDPSRIVDLFQHDIFTTYRIKALKAFSLSRKEETSYYLLSSKKKKIKGRKLAKVLM